MELISIILTLALSFSLISKGDLPGLGRSVLDPRITMNKRWRALERLSEAGLSARAELVRIAIAPYKFKSFAALEYQAEAALRISAVESLDRLTPIANLRPDIAAIAQNTTDSTVQMLAFVSLRGIDQGRPGKLIRFEEQMAKEHAAGARKR